MSDNSSQPIKFDLSFTPEVYKYIEIYKKSQKKPSIEGFARRIETDVATVWAWANKKKKDDDGNITDELARPKFYEAIKKLEEIENAPDEEKLNAKQELFCQLYATDRDFFANGTTSYLEAYGLNANDPKDRANARSSASDLLTKPNILKRIREIMELGEFNDEFVDKELQFVIAQRNDLSAKTAAIREYNKLKSRIIEKFDHTTKGRAMPRPIYGGKSDSPKV